MKLHQSLNSEINLITAYTQNHVVIANETHNVSLIVTPQTITTDWSPSSLATLTQADLEAVVELKPEVVLLGTGLKIRFPDPKITTPLIENAIGLEVMDTAAACRTYNILASEGRKIAAALIIERS